MSTGRNRRRTASATEPRTDLPVPGWWKQVGDELVRVVDRAKPAGPRTVSYRPTDKADTGGTREGLYFGCGPEMPDLVISLYRAVCAHCGAMAGALIQEVDVGPMLEYFADGRTVADVDPTVKADLERQSLHEGTRQWWWSGPAPVDSADDAPRIVDVADVPFELFETNCPTDGLRTPATLRRFNDAASKMRRAGHLNKVVKLRV
jgi:hypothetical protein